MPSPVRFDEEIRDLVVAALELRARYRSEYRLGLEAPGGGFATVHRGGQPSNPTVATVESPGKRRTRADVRGAARAVRAAHRELQRAGAALAGAEVRQPRRDVSRAVVSQEDFDRALHLQRERALRGEE